MSTPDLDCITFQVRKGMTAKLFRRTKPEDSEITACSLSFDCSEVVYGMKDGKVKVINFLMDSFQNMISVKQFL